jgi:hypothetical protein
VTGYAIVAGGFALPDGLRLTIVSDPLAIPSETGRVEPALIVVPEECEGKTGTWTAPVYTAEPERVKVVSVSELEIAEKLVPAATPTRELMVSKFLPGIEGPTKGTIIHEVLRGRDASTVLKEYGEYSEEHVRQCEEIRSVFLSSDLMKRVKRSFCEIPFVVTIERKQVSGKIDRLCELDDGSWVVIDYKSEVISQRENTVLDEEYAVSMSVYCKAARQSVHKPVIGMLYLTEISEFRRLEIDEEKFLEIKK